MSGRSRRFGPPHEARIVVAVLSLALVVSLVGAPASAAEPSLPSGFMVKDMPSGQSELLTDFAFAPNGSYFTIGKNGRVAWVSAAGSAKTLAMLPVVTKQDLGLSGVAVAHDYTTSRTIYTTRTLDVGGSWVMRLSAWTVSGSPEPSSLTNERVVLQLAANADVHAMTTVIAATDGTVWVSVGDSADFRFVDPLALRALDINQGYGKLLRILPNGAGVSSNPFYDAANPNSWKSRVYASGFRSPFRFSIDPTSGAPILGDVGWSTYEEINLVRPGANYGWPCWEASTQTAGYKDMAACRGVGNSKPLWEYVHGPLGTSVTGGIVYTGTNYPAAYRGAYFFGDYSSQRVYTLRYDSAGNLTRRPEAGGFGTGNGLPVKFAAAANGDIIYADIGGSKLKRLIYTAGNRAPTAKAATTTNASTRTVWFDGSVSNDLDGDPLKFRWDFGDGTTGTGVKTSHTYAAPGTTPLTATLTVTDPLGAQGSVTFTVVPANNSPEIAMSAPAADVRFMVGDTIHLGASANDVEDGALPVSWQVMQIHCSGGYCHNHPGESTPGQAFSKVFEDHGDDTRLEITAAATDKYGVSSQKTYIAQPKLRALTVESNVPSAINVNGTPRTNAQLTVGARASIIAPSTASDGVATFERWADGAARERTIVMPDSDTTYRAIYLTPIETRYKNDAYVRSAVGAPVAAEEGDKYLRYREYSRGRIYWTPRSGVRETHGAIAANYKAGGAHVRYGEPITDETATPDGIGRFNDFYGTPATRRVSVYWTPSTGAHAVYGQIRLLWRGMGAERSVHGYPVSDELTTPNGRGRYNSFQNGGIYWLPAIGARSVYGGIYRKWAQHRWENGFLGFPLTNETSTPDRTGRYNHFEGGSIYWTPRTGAHEVHGAIRARWAAMGWERSYLGYPTSDEFSIPGGRRSNFQYGYITWNGYTGQVVDRRY